MAYTCETCGKVMQSEGSFGLHELTAHVPGAPAPAGGAWAPPPPPPPPPGAYGQYPDPYGRYGSPRRTSATKTVVLTLGAVGVGVVLLAIVSLVALTTLGTQAKHTPVALIDPAAPPALPADFHGVNKPDDGYFIGLPASFEEVPLTAGSVDRAVDALEATNPKLAEQLRSHASVFKQARLFAVDTSNGNNESVQRIVLNGSGTIDDVPVGTFTGAYRDAGVTDVREERVHLPAGDSLKLTATVPLGSRTALITQHVLVRDSTAWILTYSQDGDGDPAQATEIASTFGWTK